MPTLAEWAKDHPQPEPYRWHVCPTCGEWSVRHKTNKKQTCVFCPATRRKEKIKGSNYRKDWND